MRDKLDTEASDRRLADLAARQHGVVTTAQLAPFGIDRRGVWRRVRAGRLHRLHRGVYAVGHDRLTQRGRWLAAVLASGRAAVLSYRSAAALWGIRPTSSGLIEVTLPSLGGPSNRPGLWVHRTRRLGADEVTCHDGIPVTTPARTLADLRRVLPPDHIRAAIRRAEVLRLEVGTQASYEPDLTRSDLERRFLSLCRRHGLPLPVMNVPIGQFVVDFLWPDRRLIVETDGFRHHGTRSAFESDRERDVRLKLLGYSVLRFTHRQVAEDAASVAAAVGALLGARRCTDGRRLIDD
jgi:very-short-patch-repair endonuclease/predicted transcriptional regulator of viral defense system